MTTTPDALPPDPGEDGTRRVRLLHEAWTTAMSWHDTPVPMILSSARYQRRLYNPWSPRFTRKLLRYMHSDWIEQQSRLVDKVAVRQLVEERVGAGYLPQLYAVADKTSKIDYDALPDRYYLKANHGARFNIPCEGRAEFNLIRARRRMRRFLATDFSTEAGERQYRHVPRKVYAEEYLEMSRPHCMMLRLFCFDGVVAFVMVDTASDRRDPRETSYYLPDWTPAPFRYGRARPHVDIPRPANLDEVLRVASTLSEGIPFVRVDLYWLDGRIVFSELTLTPSRGTRQLVPSTYDKELGRRFVLPAEGWRPWVTRTVRAVRSSLRPRLRRSARRMSRRAMKAEPLWLVVHRVLGLQRPLRRRTVALSSIPGDVGHVIVPGAGVRAGGVISQVLRERLDRAIEVARARPDVLVLVSGDGRKKARREDRVMKADLVAHGISAERILTDPRGFSTVETMDRARRRGITSAVVVTNDFHVARAVHVASRVGIDAYAVGNHRSRSYSDADRPLRFDERRELMAHVKDWAVLTTRRPRRVLGRVRRRLRGAS